jgi:kynurenine formamidase
MRIVDLTLELEDGTQTHPAHPRCVVIEFARHGFTAPRFQPPCRGFASRILMFSDHIGTHVDAPFHYFPEKGTIESVPLERLVGPAVWLDFSKKLPDQPITPEMLEAECRTAGVGVEAGDILLFRGWPGHHTDEGFLRCAGMSGAAAEWAVARGIKALGCDLATPDDPRDLTRPVHLALLGRGIPIMEHVVNLEAIPARRFQFVGVPLKIKGASGSPIRAFAMLNA